jgi:hypothetical protein
MRDAKGTRRSRRSGAADHRRLVVRPRATHIPACTLTPSPAGGGLRLGRKLLGRVPACMSIVFESTRPIFQRIRRIRRGLVRNTSIRGVQPVAHNTNFDSFLVVKKVLCASSCTPRKQRNTRMDLFRTIETIFVPGWYKNSFNSTKHLHSWYKNSFNSTKQVHSWFHNICHIFIPLEFISYPKELFSYLVQDFHTYLV